MLGMGLWHTLVGALSNLKVHVQLFSDACKTSDRKKTARISHAFCVIAGTADDAVDGAADSIKDSLLKCVKNFDIKTIVSGVVTKATDIRAFIDLDKTSKSIRRVARAQSRRESACQRAQARETANVPAAVPEDQPLEGEQTEEEEHIPPKLSVELLVAIAFSLHQQHPDAVRLLVIGFIFYMLAVAVGLCVLQGWDTSW